MLESILLSNSVNHTNLHINYITYMSKSQILQEIIIQFSHTVHHKDFYVITFTK